MKKTYINPSVIQFPFNDTTERFSLNKDPFDRDKWHLVSDLTTDISSQEYRIRLFFSMEGFLAKTDEKVCLEIERTHNQDGTIEIKVYMPQGETGRDSEYNHEIMWYTFTKEEHINLQELRIMIITDLIPSIGFVPQGARGFIIFNSPNFVSLSGK